MEHTDKAKSDAKRIPLPEPPKPKPRSDLSTARQDESTYITKVQRPNLQDRERHVIEGFKRGLSLESLIRNSGYPVRTIFSIIGRDPLENPDEFNRLETFKANLLTHKV
jgi:hypothetical protein